MQQVGNYMKTVAKWLSWLCDVFILSPMWVANNQSRKIVKYTCTLTSITIANVISWISSKEDQRSVVLCWPQRCCVLYFRSEWILVCFISKQSLTFFGKRVRAMQSWYGHFILFSVYKICLTTYWIFACLSSMLEKSTFTGCFVSCFSNISFLPNGTRLFALN